MLLSSLVTIILSLVDTVTIFTSVNFELVETGHFLSSQNFYQIRNFSIPFFFLAYCVSDRSLGPRHILVLGNNW